MTHPPADPRLSAASIATNIPSGLCQIADRHGIACTPWFAGLRLTRAQIDDADGRVSYRQASRIIQRAMRSLQLPDLGLQLGCNQNIGSFGLLGLAMMTARDFGEAVAIGLQYAPVTGGLMDLELDPSDSAAMALVAHARAPDAQLLPFLCEELFASTLMLSRALVGPEFRPLRLELGYPEPSYADAYAAVFQCEIRYGQPRNRMLVDPAWLSHALPNYNPVSARQALALCRAQMPGDEQPSEIVAAVRNLLRARLQDNPGMAVIAAELHLTERTLRRQLAAAGTAFKSIHDAVRSERAHDLLHERRLPISQIGARIGFRDAREFRRAFKRWNGITPREARDRG